MKRIHSKNKIGNQISGKANLVFNLIFILYSILCLYPLALVIGTSFADENYLMEFGYKVFPKVTSLYAYEYIGKNLSVILRAYGITIFVTLVGTVLSTLFTALYAYAITRKAFKARKFFTFIMFFTMLFNGGMVPWYMVCTQVLKIQNTIIALIWPTLVSAWNVMIMKTFFNTSVPDAIVESAKIDGASELRTFFKIVCPVAIPGIATIALFAMLGYWNDWYLPLMLTTDPKLSNIQYYLYRIVQNLKVLTDTSSAAYQQSGQSIETIPKESARMAICVISIGPIILAYPFFQRYFVKGLTIGAVKE
ncbi:MAG: carbohydrate ABC transporter permease [Monoglobaceae bacterium]